MSSCPYFEQVTQNRRGVPHTKFLCGVTGQPCLVDRPTAGHCARYEWYSKATSKAAAAPVTSADASAATQGGLL